MTILGVDIDNTLTKQTTHIWNHDTPDSLDLDIANQLLLADERLGIEVLSKCEKKVILVTSRHEEYRDVTLKWLQTKPVKHEKLVMRDFRFSTGVFNFNEYLQYKLRACLENDIKCMLDDDINVVNMLNSYGIISVMVDRDGRFDDAYFELIRRIE